MGRRSRSSRRRDRPPAPGRQGEEGHPAASLPPARALAPRPTTTGRRARRATAAPEQRANGGSGQSPKAGQATERRPRQVSSPAQAGAPGGLTPVPKRPSRPDAQITQNAGEPTRSTLVGRTGGRRHGPLACCRLVCDVARTAAPPDPVHPVAASARVPRAKPRHGCRDAQQHCRPMRDQTGASAIHRERVSSSESSAARRPRRDRVISSW